MKKLKLSLVALCLFVLLFPLLLSGSADTAFIFTTFDGTVARNDLNKTVPEETMTFASGSNYYVYYEHFSKLTVIAQVYYNTRSNEIVLFNMNKSLIFDLANDQAYERPSGTFYSQTAKWRGGNVFLPLSVVAEAFNLSISYIDSGYSPAPLLRIDSQAPSIGDSYYVQQLSAFLHNLHSNTLALSQVTSPGETVQPTTTPPEKAPDPAKLVYLCFEDVLGDNTHGILDSLAESPQAAATFFVPPGSILQNAEVIRRAYSEGHAIGLLLPGGWASPELAVDALRDANELLKSVVLTKTRLVCIESGLENESTDVLEALISQGCRLWNSNVQPDLSGRATVNQVMSGLRSSLSRASGTAVVRLDSGDVTAAVLPTLLGYIGSGNYSLLAVTEWDRPINRADEIR